MVRSSLALSLVLAAALLSGRAEACEAHADNAKASSTAVDTASEKKDAPTTLELLHEVDVLVADKCSCANASECTCKKGKCKCKGCKKGSRLAEPIKGQSDALRLPKEARYDASTGVFI